MPDSNPNLGELKEREPRAPDPWPLEAMAENDELEVAQRLGVTGWEDELATLRRDVRAIPEAPRPEHVLPAPETHSPSSLMDLQTCPRRYYHTHIFPIPILEAGVEEAQDYGSVVHAYIEGGMQGEPPRVSRNGGAGDGHASRNETWKALGAGEYGRRAAEYPLYEGPEPPKTRPARMVEVPFALPIEGTEIRGRIDAIFIDQDGTFHIVDWKTGRPHEGYKERLQLPLYALAAERLWGVEPEKMRIAYAFVPGDAVAEVDTQGDFLGRAEEQVLGALDLIQSGRFEPTPSRYGCSRCPVMGIGITGCPTEVPGQ